MREYVRTPEQINADLDRIQHYGERIGTMHTRAIVKLGMDMADLWRQIGEADRAEALSDFFTSEVLDDAATHETTGEER